MRPRLKPGLLTRLCEASPKARAVAILDGPPKIASRSLSCAKRRARNHTWPPARHLLLAPLDLVDEEPAPGQDHRRQQQLHQVADDEGVEAARQRLVERAGAGDELAEGLWRSGHGPGRVGPGGGAKGG